MVHSVKKKVRFLFSLIANYNRFMGILYIVATPIGNLKDITARALEVLKEVDLVVCEDTRETIKLLNHFEIKKPLVSYFQHSQLSKIEYIAGELAAGKKVALVTDAGTPGISDPGGKLISLLVDKFISFKNLKTYSEAELKNLLTIIPIPGPNAAIAALSVSGFPADRFVFMGFPPHKKGRNKFFDEVAQTKYTVVFYESPHRILKTLKELSLRARLRLSAAAQSLPTGQAGNPEENRGIATAPAAPRNDARQLVVCRELTKMFESIYRGTAEEILKKLLEDKNNQKGEFVVIARAN